jgi:hypothetical protein
MESDFKKVSENFYTNLVFGENYDDASLSKKNFSLALFSFFGTLVWGESGALYDYDRILLSSPVLKENLINLNNLGYTICVIEYVPEKKLEKFENLVNIFYQSVNNKIDIFFFAYTEKDINISNKLIKFFDPECKNSFGKNSFYCGIEIDKYHDFPWFRKSDRDTKISKQLSMNLYNPNDILGYYSNKKYVKNTLYIVCGAYYSGWEIDLESFKDTVKHEGIHFRYKKENDVEIYAIESEDLLSSVKNLIPVDDKAIVVFGKNPSFEDRERLRLHFTNYFLTVVHWYARYPYKKSDNNKSYHKNFKNPLLYAEIFERIN